MIILAMVLTTLAVIWTIIVVFADSMRSSPQPSDVGGASVAVMWLLAAAGWLAWFFK